MTIFFICFASKDKKNKKIKEEYFSKIAEISRNFQYRPDGPICLTTVKVQLFICVLIVLGIFNSVSSFLLFTILACLAAIFLFLFWDGRLHLTSHPPGG